MSIEGRLRIRLETAAGGVHAVNIESSRPVHASTVLHGKSMGEARSMIPLIYSVCGTAQACAGARAAEQAMGTRVSPRLESLREALVGMETLREHLWRILLDWPAFNDESADKAGMAEVVAIQADYRRALQGHAGVFGLGGTECAPDPARLASIRDRLIAITRQAVFACDADEWLEISSRDALFAWAVVGESSAARLIDAVAAAGWSGAGACACAALPDIDDASLDEAMRSGYFTREPQWSGECRETSVLTRVDSPLLNVLKCEYGNGLLVRLVARLTEIARLLGRLFSFPAPGGEGDTVAAELSESDATRTGIGKADAARGRLVHRVELQAGKIRNYCILAPTEWNFHPRGVVVRALAALNGSHAQLEWQARLLIDAIDPCVGYELNIVET